MYLLDTNICIAIIQSNSSAVAQFQLVLNQFANQLPKVNFDENAAREFGKIQGELRKIGRPTGQLDALIAAVSRFREENLVTHNTRHFIHIQNLQLEDWLIP